MELRPTLALNGQMLVAAGFPGVETCMTERELLRQEENRPMKVTGVTGAGGPVGDLSRPARLSSIGDTIRSCAHILAVDPSQFAAQFLLRMETADDPAGYRGLLDTAA